MKSSDGKAFSVDWGKISAATVALFAFAVYVIFPISSDEHYLSPDETANAAFARQYARTGTVRIPAPYVEYSADIHPRSFQVAGNSLVPLSFAGFPISLGLAARLFGDWIIPYITPIFFLFAALAVYAIANVFFGKRAAVLSSILFSVHPVIGYYAARGLWHNGLFSYILVIGAASWILATKRKSFILFLTGALCGAAAIMIRPSESAWLVIFFLAVLLGCRPLPRRWLLAAGGLAGLGLVIFFLYSTRVLGNSLTAGYPILSSVPQGHFLAAAWQQFQLLIFPFGIDFGNALGRFYRYTFQIAGPIFIFGFIGLLKIFRDPMHARARWFAGAVIFAGTWLVFSYGSFNFSETFFREGVTLGSSYLRYWLPVYVLLACFAGSGIEHLSERLRHGNAILGIALAATVSVSFLPVLIDPLYGMSKAIGKDLRTAQQERQRVLAIVPETDVIFAGTSDKVFYPERIVAGYNQLTNQMNALPSLEAAHIGAWLVTADPQEVALAQQEARALGAHFQLIEELPGQDRLYRLIYQ